MFKRDKRERNKFDQTSKEKAYKIAKTASATVAGAAFFRRSSAGKKFVTEYFPVAKETYKGFMTTLSSQKSGRIKASDIARAYDNNIGHGGEVFRSNLKAQAKKVALNKKNLADFGEENHLFKTERTTGLFGLDIERKGILARDEIKKVIRKQKETELKENLIDDLVLKFAKSSGEAKYTRKQMRSIVYNTYDDIEKALDVDRKTGKTIFNKSYNRRMLNDIGIEEDDREELLKAISNQKDNIKKAKDEVQSSTVEDAARVLLNSDEVIRYQTDHYIYRKIDKALNKLGIKINSEMALTGSRAVTIGDLSDKQIRQLSKVQHNFGDTKEAGYSNLGEEIWKLKNNKKYQDVIIDKSLKIDKKGNIYSTEDFDEYARDIRRDFSSTLFAKIMYSGIDAENQINKPIVKVLESGKKTFQEEGAKALNSRIYIRGKVHEIRYGGQEIGGESYYTLDEVGKEGHLINIMHGKSARIVRDVLGTDNFYSSTSKSKIMKKLDLNQNNKKSYIQSLREFLKKDYSKDDDLNEHQVIRRVLDIVQSENPAEVLFENEKNGWGGSEENYERLFEDMKKFKEMLEYHTYSNPINDRMFRSLGDNYTSNEPLGKIFSAVISDKYSDDQLFEIINQNRGDLHGDLKSLLREWKRNPGKVHELLNIQSNPEYVIPIIQLPASETNVLGIRELIKKGLIDEMLSDMQSGATDTNLFLAKDLISTLEDVTEKEKDALYSHVMLNSLNSRFEELKDPKGESFELDKTASHMARFFDVISGTGEAQQKSLNIIKNVHSDYGIFNKGSISNALNDVNYDEYGQYDVINKSSAGNIIGDIFDFAFGRGETDEIGKQLITDINNFTKEIYSGGRNDKEHFTPLTMLAHFSMSRLSMGVEDVGLGLSSESMASPGELAKNIFLKRVLPAMAVVQGVSYLNYEARNLTGVSLTGAAANVMSSADLAARNIADHTGIGYMYNRFKNTSVISEYLTGSDEYQDRDERAEWYQNGESIVRKARFWSFGSSSEFRGTSIQYYQPNYLRRAHSNWKDVGVYGSSDEKWSHSPLPSLRYPLSPLLYLWDPYWLEKKNQDTRPYPVSAKMFSEGTPWGAVLNPTLGQIIKPQKEMGYAKKRLKSGRDAKAILKEINERIKQGGDGRKEYEDMIIASGTGLRNAEYIPYGNPTDEQINLTISNGKVTAPGLDYMENIEDINNYRVPDGTYITGYEGGDGSGGSGYSSQGGSGSGYSGSGGGGYDREKVVYSTGKYKSEFRKKVDEITDEVIEKDSPFRVIGKTLIQGINEGILRRGKTKGPIVDIPNTTPPNEYLEEGTALPNKEEGTFIYKNLLKDKNKANLNYYEEKYNNPKAAKASLNKDYIRDVGYSGKQLSGIYGFAYEMALGSDYKSFRYENAGQMASFTRSFWDASIGGLGDSLMEISRRFFPSTDKSRVNINPLMNDMPDWLPENYQMGDPYVKIPKGEMRLPGKGYETIHELHPDNFADDGYGAFDRFKILSDVAPYSDEYKTWKSIAKNTVKDEDLIKQMEDIEEKVAKKSGDHEFYKYRYKKTGTEYKEGVVKAIDIKNAVVTMVSGEQFKLAGIKANTDPEAEVTTLMTDILNPGDKVRYRTTIDPELNLNEFTAQKRAVFYKKDNIDPTGSRNLNKEMMDSGMFERDKTDRTSLGYMARTGAIGETLGLVQETIAHLPIPFIHNKFLKIETPLESFKNEHVYGSNFSTWDHPIEGFVKPMIYQSWGQTPMQKAAALGVAAFHFGYAAGKENKLLSKASMALLSSVEPTAFLFGSINWGMRMGNGLNKVGRKELKTVFKNATTAYSRGAGVGVAVGAIGWGLANANDPITAGLSFGAASMAAAKYLGDTSEVIAKRLPEEILNNKFFKGKVTTGKIGAIGAAVGVGISAYKLATMPKEDRFKKWTPAKTKKKFKIDEYFDRLEYIKYQGLYKKASRKAAVYEGSNIRQAFKEIDKNKKKVGKLRKKAVKISNKYLIGTYEYDKEMGKIKDKLMSLEESQNKVFKSRGKYTKAAIAYKKAADSTIYGLNSGSSQDEIMASIPNQYKDHFMEFMKETNEGERKRILKYIPEYLQKPLKIAWGQDYEVRSNARYFKRKHLPNFTWRGWKPNINIDHVKMKTIESEGMLLSDFGYYESEKSKAQYEMATPVKMNGGSSLANRLSLVAASNGLGMPLTNVSVERTSAPGISIISNITQTAKDTSAVVSYAGSSLMGLL